jgi:hypothetical protein
MPNLHAVRDQTTTHQQFENTETDPSGTRFLTCKQVTNKGQQHGGRRRQAYNQKATTCLANTLSYRRTHTRTRTHTHTYTHTHTGCNTCSRFSQPLCYRGLVSLYTTTRLSFSVRVVLRECTCKDSQASFLFPDLQASLLFPKKLSSQASFPFPKKLSLVISIS